MAGQRGYFALSAVRASRVLGPNLHATLMNWSRILKRATFMLRRVHDAYWNKIVIAVVGFVRDGVEHVFDNKPVVSQEWLRDRAHSRIAYAEMEPAE